MSSCRERFAGLAAIMRGNAESECFAVGATDAEIAAAERQLDARFPESYRCLLREFGMACWPDYIYGLHPYPLPGLHVVRETEDGRHKSEPFMPSYLVPFSPDGAGNSYCFDTRHFEDGECPVVFWDHDRDEHQQPERTHCSFLDWLEEKIEFELEE